MSSWVFYLFLFLFSDLFNIDSLQILRYYKKLENTIAYHIADLRQRTKYIMHTNIQTITKE